MRESEYIEYLAHMLDEALSPEQMEIGKRVMQDLEFEEAHDLDMTEDFLDFIDRRKDIYVGAPLKKRIDYCCYLLNIQIPKSWLASGEKICPFQKSDEIGTGIFVPLKRDVFENSSFTNDSLKKLKKIVFEALVESGIAAEALDNEKFELKFFVPYPESDRAYLNITIDPDEWLIEESIDSKSILHSQFSEEEVDAAIQIFGLTDNLDSAGWILPDWRLLDCHKDDNDEWIEHAEIGNAFSQKRLEVADGISGYSFQGEIEDICTAACMAGLIRIGHGKNGFYCQIATKPTLDQYDVLYDCQDKDWQEESRLDHLDYVQIVGKHDLKYHSQEDFERRLVNDIKHEFQ